MISSLHERKNRILPALWVCLASCGLTVLLLAAVYALRGVWPFGPDNVAYMDAAQFYLPGYYSLWDTLHGGLSSGGWRELLYPYNWPFLFVARDHVLEAMSLYLALRLVIIAAIAAAVLCRRFPRVGGLWKTLFALLYTFSGFVLQYYSNFAWLEVAAVFPLLLLGLESLFREGRYVLYTVMYAYLLRLNVYYAYMATIYILLFALGYCLILLPKDRRGDRLFRLGLSTVAALGICSYQWTRTTVSLAGGARFQQNLDTGLEAGMSTWNLPNTRHTFLMLLGMSLPAAAGVRALLRQKAAPDAQRGRAIRFFGYMLGMFLLPMVFTNIDTAWHFGQYNFFPMRYGYMLPATLIGGACAALEDEARRPVPGPESSGRPGWLPWAAGAAGAGILLLAPRVAAVVREYGACFLDDLGAAGYLRWFAMYAVCGVLFAALYLALLRMDRRWSLWALAAAVLLQIGTSAWGHIAPNDDHTYTHEYDPAYIETSEALYGYFSQQDTPYMSRVKNVDNSLNAGYPAIAGVSALSSINSGNSAGRLAVYDGLGYTTNYFRILDTGGTVFSDMLFNVVRVLSATPLDEDLYVPGDTVDGIRIGSARYPGVLGLMYDEDALADYFDLQTVPDRLNALYRAFTDSSGTLARDLAPQVDVSGDGMRAYTLTCRLDEPAFLYLAVDGMAMNITANGETITVPSYLNLRNTVYPAPFNGNLLSLGLFGTGETEVCFSSAMDLTQEDLLLMSVDKALMDSFPADANRDGDMTMERIENGYAITLTADREGRRLYLPVTPNTRRCTVNGRPVELSYFIGVMTSVPLQAGENTVLITTGGGSPAGFDRGRILPAACLFLALLWLVLRRVFPKLQTLVLPKAAGIAVQALFFTVAAAVLIFVYAAPMYMLLTRGSVVWF